MKSKEAADQLPLEQLEHGLRILHAYEKVPQHNLKNKDSVLQQITEVIWEYDEGQSEDWEMPFWERASQATREHINCDRTLGCIPAPDTARVPGVRSVYTA